MDNLQENRRDVVYCNRYVADTDSEQILQMAVHTKTWKPSIIPGNF